MRLIPTGNKMKTPFEILLRRRIYKMEKAERYEKLHPEKVAAIKAGQQRRAIIMRSLTDSDSAKQQSQMLKTWNVIGVFFGDCYTSIRNNFVYFFQMLRDGMQLRQNG